MARRNGCTGETEYPNGCTASGYILSTALVVILCVVVPVTHHFYFSNAPPSPSRACLRRVDLTPEEHADALSLYFRYEVQPKSACTFETRILRGCVEDTTSQIGFARYPPGPLRTKNARDIRESFEYVERDFLAVPRRAEDGDACPRHNLVLHELARQALASRTRRAHRHLHLGCAPAAARLAVAACRVRAAAARLAVAACRVRVRVDAALDVDKGKALAEHAPARHDAFQPRE